MKAFVYILKDKKDKFYIGSTTDIKRRLRQHENKHTPTTRRMMEPKLALAQEYDSLEIARKIERRLKKLKRKDYIEKIVEDGYIGMAVNKCPRSSTDRTPAF